MDLAQKLISALTELVELKDLKAKIEKPGGWQGTIGPNGLDLGELPKLQAEYARRKEPAWSNARNVLQELKAVGLFTETSDKICKEPDGCPTELAVLQRFWREVQGQKNA